MDNNRKKVKIAVVEDEESLQRVLVEWLSGEGYEAIGITTGLQAVELIPKIKPDLVLLDIILPEISGFQVMQVLKEDPETRNIPVIILTNLGDDGNQKKALELGAADYLVKADFNLEAVLKVIQRVMRE